MTSLDGWRRTVRSIRWSPVVVTPVVASAAILVVGVLSGHESGRGISFVADAGLGLSAAVAAFIADDPTLEAAPATPVAAGSRLVARAAAVVPVVVAGWLLVLVVYDRFEPNPAAVDVAGRALAGVGLATAALGLAALARRIGSVQSPGAAAVGAVAVLGVTSCLLPARLVQVLPSGRALWLVTILAAVVTVAVTTREPLS